MEDCNILRKFFCHTTLAILTLLILKEVETSTATKSHIVMDTSDVSPNQQYHNDRTPASPPPPITTPPITPTSTIRPWPSDKFLRKVLRVKQRKQNNATITKVQRRPSNNRNAPHHNVTKKHSWSHYQAKHDTNLSSGAEYKLHINSSKNATRLTNQPMLDHKNQSIDNNNMQSRHQDQDNNNSSLMVNTEKSKIVFLHEQNNSSAGIQDLFDVNQGKNLPGKAIFIHEDAQSWDEQISGQNNPVNYERSPIHNNYGIGFQYEISPNKYQTTSHSSFPPILSPTPELTSTTTSTTTMAPTTTLTTPKTTQLIVTFPPQMPEKVSPENAERSNTWKKIPTLTVTIRPLGELYSSSTLSKRTKTKRPWGFGWSTQKPPPTHAHFPYPFKTKFTSTPPPSVTFAHLEFDTPASPSPETMIKSPTPTPGSGFDFDTNFGFSSHVTSPFSPLTTPPPPLLPPHQHVHIRPIFETHHQSPIRPSWPSEISSVQSSSSISSLTRPFTNIWYKPIINHFISSGAASSSTDPVGDTTPTTYNEFPAGLIFKVWNYNKDGKLTLVNENVIPSSALEGFQLENGAILNFDQIPLSVQDTVASAISEFNQNQDNFQSFDDPEYGFQPSLKANGGGVHGSDRHDIQQSHSITKPNIKTNRKYVNYVIVETKTKNPAAIKVANIETKLHDDENEANLWHGHRHRSTTYRPHVVTPEESKPSIDQSWQQLHDLLLSVKDIQLPTPVEKDSVSASPASPESPSKTSETDSFQTEKIGNKQLLADMAAIAILISYLKNRKNNLVNPNPQLSKNDDPPPPSNTEAPTTYVTSMLKNDNVLDIFDHLIQEMKNRTDFQTKTRKTPTTTEPPDPVESHLIDVKPQIDKSLLVLKGLVKKGIKKKKKKKIKKLLSKVTKPIAHIFKKPKDYWFDVKFDVDLYDILKKKFLYYLALKYFPVALIVALKLVPLALFMIPILWKIYWVKKRPKYIRVPVPYPVYKYIRPHRHRHHEHHPDYDESSNRPVSNPHDPGSTFLRKNPYHHPPPPPIVLKTPGGLGPHPIDLQNEVNRLNNMRPHAVTHAYELGFDLGSRLGTMSNNHDEEVLKILIGSRKDKIKRLLEKWNLYRRGRRGHSATTPIQRLGHFVTERHNNHMKNLESFQDNEIPIDETPNNKEIPFVKKKRKKKK